MPEISVVGEELDRKLVGLPEALAAPVPAVLRATSPEAAAGCTPHHLGEHLAQPRERAD